MKKCLLGILCLLLLNACKQSSPTSSPPPAAKKPPTVNSFVANPAEINLGQISTISWDVSNATSISIDQGIGTVSATGSKEVKPETTTTYTLTATNNDGQTTKSCTITVKAVANVVMIAGPIYEESTWTFTYKGIVKNIGNSDAEWVKIYIYIHKPNGDLITFEYSYADDYMLAPNETSAWDVSFWDDGKAIRNKMEKSKTTYEIKWEEKD